MGQGSIPTNGQSPGARGSAVIWEVVHPCDWRVPSLVGVALDLASEARGRRTHHRFHDGLHEVVMLPGRRWGRHCESGWGRCRIDESKKVFKRQINISDSGCRAMTA
jgi:hypothetical protein